MVHKGKLPLLPKKNNVWFILEEAAKILYQQLADGLGSISISQGFYFAMCETGEVGQMISKLKLPLHGSERRFWFVSQHLTVLYPTQTLPNMYILEQFWKALLGVSSQGKELEIKKKSTYACSVCVIHPESLQGHSG